MNRTDLSRRAFLAGAAATGAVITTGCGSGSSSQDAKSLTFLNEETDPPTLEFLNKSIRQYKKETGVSVALTSKAPSNMTQLLSSVQAGDAFSLSTTAVIQTAFLGSNVLSSQDSLIEQFGGADGFIPGCLLKENGEYIAFPYNINCSGQYYRTDRLEQVGSDIPKTWDELGETLKKLSDAKLPGAAQPYSATWSTSDVGAEVLWSNHVEFFDSEGNVILGESDMKSRCIQCLEFLQSTKPYIVGGMETADYGDIVKTFVNGDASVAGYSGRIIDTIDKEQPSLKDKFTYTTYPTPEANMEPSYGFGVNYWVIPKAAQVQLASDFLKWFVKDHFTGYLLTGAYNMQPPLLETYREKDWYDSPELSQHPELWKKMRKMALGEGYRQSGIWFMPPGPGALTNQVLNDNVIPKMYQSVLIAGNSPEKAVDNATDQLRQMSSSF